MSEENKLSLYLLFYYVWKFVSHTNATQYETKFENQILGTWEKGNNKKIYIIT
jgi:hypothetical protein